MAKEGALQHPDLLGNVAAHDAVMGEWGRVASAVADMLALWPSAKVLLGPLQKVPRPPNAPSLWRRHCLVWGGSRWLCTRCWTTFTDGARAQAQGVCAALPRAVRSIITQHHSSEGRRHRFWLARVQTSNAPCLFCNTSCAYTVTRAKHLSGACGDIYKQQLAQLRAGKLPWPRGQRITRPWPLMAAGTAFEGTWLEALQFG